MTLQELLLDKNTLIQSEDIEILVHNPDMMHFFDLCLKSMMDRGYFMSGIETCSYAKELFNAVVNYNPKGIGNAWVFAMLIYFQTKGDLSGYETKRMIETKYTKIEPQLTL